jgi:putative transposase
VEKAPVAQTPPKKPSPGSRGRPKGSKKRNRREGACSPSRRFIQGHLGRLRQQIGDHLKVVSVLFDGEFGHNDTLQMVRQLGLHLVSKLRDTSALYFPYEGPSAGRGPRRKYGKKLDDRNLPAKPLQTTAIEDGIKTDIYQMSVWQKTFADLLTIVVIVKGSIR